MSRAGCSQASRKSQPELQLGVCSTDTSHYSISCLPAKPPSLPLPTPPSQPSPQVPAGALTLLLAPTLLPSARPCTGLAVPGSGHHAMAAHGPACRAAGRACVSPACAVRLLHGRAPRAGGWPCGLIGRWGGSGGLGEDAGRIHASAAALADPQPHWDWSGVVGRGGSWAVGRQLPCCC